MEGTCQARAPAFQARILGFIPNESRKIGAVEAVRGELLFHQPPGVLRKKSHRSEFSPTFHAATFSSRYS